MWQMLTNQNPAIWGAAQGTAVGMVTEAATHEAPLPGCRLGLILASASATPAVNPDWCGVLPALGWHIKNP